MMHICNDCNNFGIYACPVSVLLPDLPNYPLFPLTQEAKGLDPFLQSLLAATSTLRFYAFEWLS